MKNTVPAVIAGLLMLEESGCVNYEAPSSCKTSTRTPDNQRAADRWCAPCLVKELLDMEGRPTDKTRADDLAAADATDPERGADLDAVAKAADAIGGAGEDAAAVATGKTVMHYGEDFKFKGTSTVPIEKPKAKAKAKAKRR
jgi:hypothetical protein